MAFTHRNETYARGATLNSPYNFTINKAVSVVNGDIMFMFLQLYSSSPPTIDSVPSGWQQIATNNTTNSRWYIYYKIASNEGNSYTWSLTNSCRYYALNIAYTSGDFDVTSLADITAISNTLYGTAGTIVRAASMYVPQANSPLVYFGSIYNTSARSFTKPSLPTTDWVEDADQGHSTPDISMTIGSMIWTGMGNTGNIDITCSTSITTHKHAFAIALKPALQPEPSLTPSVSISRTPSITPSISISRTPSVSITPSISISRTPSISITASISNSRTPSISFSRTPSISITPSISFSRTPSFTPSLSFSRTPSITPSLTPSISFSKTPIISVSVSLTKSITPTISITPSFTLSLTPTPSEGYEYSSYVVKYSESNNPNTIKLGNIMFGKQNSRMG